MSPAAILWLGLVGGGPTSGLLMTPAAIQWLGLVAGGKPQPLNIKSQDLL
ncbi:hypothetical protein T484DRAFT_1887796 [Baffinella frigidus]|nr:hypothetical protein T484DRAFT_1887796 [Cryptophyta sp. CCMP2293]